MKKTLLLFLTLFLIIAAGCSNSDGSTSAEEESPEKVAAESNFPEKTIKLIVPFSPGSLNDNQMRLLAKAAEEFLPNKQAITIENVEGGGGIIAMTELMNAKPDGYTIGQGTISHVSVLPHYGDASFTHDSFQHILRNTAAIPMLVVQADAPWNSYDELVAYAKENPGKFRYATTGEGSISNLNIVAVSKEHEIELKNIPFEGGSQGITALLGGHIDGAVVMPSDAVEHIAAGKLKPLFVYSQEDTEYETAATLKDYGLESGLPAVNFLLAPKGLPAEELAILHDAFSKAQEDPEVLEYLDNLYLGVHYLGPEEAQEDSTRSHELAGKLLKELGLID
ncbi:hypothetical protein CSV79_13350 [Sporosarcina sp. P13]|uniref:tripartite tricarboxylate transporter substrate binding protein n=1 Tax=Sporosarcina sp. P13 TaxID=2048263 RepID=UPI000C172B91|nr:tripartite tricarboxylate transporter substrate binding protein [Sporosarcina sp. P13]PIC63133.1 hypothetical protein CSV79_13350 [Sporosarcina sp. P13]